MDKYTQLESINLLKEKWVLTEEEFQTEKKKILWELADKDSEKIKSNSNWTSEYGPILDEIKLILNERINRKSYLKWLFFYIPATVMWIFLITSFISLALIRFKLLDKVDEIGNTIADRISSIVHIPILILIIIMYCVFTIKRFHDIGKSGWHILIPIYWIITPIITPWIKGDNRFWSVSE